jgi:hypothetical protein
VIHIQSTFACFALYNVHVSIVWVIHIQSTFACLALYNVHVSTNITCNTIDALIRERLMLTTLRLPREA